MRTQATDGRDVVVALVGVAPRRQVALALLAAALGMATVSPTGPCVGPAAADPDTAGALDAPLHFYPDDPLRADRDHLDTPVRPAEIELSDLYDRFSHIISDVGSTPIGSEADNVNTLDEVPDSSWFTNRHGVRRMSVEGLVRGPDSGTGPDPDRSWEVFKSKSQGLTPGFQIADAEGERYVIKLDPIAVPRLSSAAEVIATKLFYAMGYNTPENYIIYVDPARFTIRPGTMVSDRFGDKVPLTERRLHRMLRRVPRLADSRIRVTASKYIAGRPIGPFRYFGTRSDDPNDVILHEQRRELRGLRLIAAWLNHDDTRAQNTQDSWVEEDGKHFVRHYLLDFGSTFGSGSVEIQLPNLSFHYWMDLDLIKKNAIAFGLHVPRYRKVEWPEFPEYAAVGRWEAEAFDPGAWKNDYPNPAFVRMTARDAFWAAKLIMSFTPEELRAIVATGQLGDPEQERYFLDTLIERQRKCGRYGLNGLNPLDRFEVTDGRLAFVNLSELHGFVEGPSAYRVAWSVFDNASGTMRPIEGATEDVESGAAAGDAATGRAVVDGGAVSVALPAPPPPSASGAPGAGEEPFLVAEIRTLNPEFPHWERPVLVYLRPAGGHYEVVGILRDDDA